MIEWLLSLPTWVIAAIVGAILGGVGGLIAAPFTRRGQKWARFIPIVFVAGGYGVTDRLVIPALLETDAALCPIAKAMADSATRQRAADPQIDEATRFTAVTADCNAKTLTTLYAVDGSAANIDHSAFTFIEQQFSREVCADQYGRRLVTAGWAINNVYEFQGDQPLVMTASCAF